MAFFIRINRSTLLVSTLILLTSCCIAESAPGKKAESFINKLPSKSDKSLFNQHLTNYVRRFKREGFIDFNDLSGMMRNMASSIGKGLTTIFNMGSNLHNRMVEYAKPKPQIIYGPWYPIISEDDPAYRGPVEATSDHSLVIKDEPNYIKHEPDLEEHYYINSIATPLPTENEVGTYGFPIGPPLKNIGKSTTTTHSSTTIVLYTSTKSHSTKPPLQKEHSTPKHQPDHYVTDFNHIKKVIAKTLYYQDLKKYKNRIKSKNISKTVNGKTIRLKRLADQNKKPFPIFGEFVTLLKRKFGTSAI